MNFLRALKGRRSVSLKGCLILAPGALLATMAVEFVAHGSLGAALVSALLITAWRLGLKSVWRIEPAGDVPHRAA